MDKAIHKQRTFHIGNYYFYINFTMVASLYKENFSLKDVEKKVKGYKKKGQYSNTKDYYLYIKAVNELSSSGIKNSRLWVDLNYPHLREEIK